MEIYEVEVAGAILQMQYSPATAKKLGLKKSTPENKAAVPENKAVKPAAKKRGRPRKAAD